MFPDPYANIRQLITLPAHAMKSYQITQPLATHFRDGTCEEAFCAQFASGWITKLDESTDLGQKQAHYIRKRSGRKFTEAQSVEGLTEFTFEAGQKCFRQHKVPLEREPNYFVRGGDFRGNPRKEVRRHANGEDWVDDFANHQIHIAEQLEEG